MCSALSLWFTNDFFFRVSSHTCQLVVCAELFSCPLPQASPFRIYMHPIASGSEDFWNCSWLKTILGESDTGPAYQVWPVVGMACCLHTLEQIGLEKYACMDRHGTLGTKWQMLLEVVCLLSRSSTTTKLDADSVGGSFHSRLNRKERVSLVGT
jgi:hypothetical protein